MRSSYVGAGSGKVESLLGYLKNLDNVQLEHFSSACNTTKGNLLQIAYGGSVSPHLAKRIHEHSDGKVLLEDLRPDIFSNIG